MARPSPIPSPPADVRPTPNLRSVAVRANLLPDEVIVARRTETLRRHVIIALGALVALLVAWFGLTWWQTRSADSDLATANGRATQLQTEQRQYSKLLTAQSTVETVQQQLSGLMSGDLPWQKLLQQVRSRADHISLTDIGATVTTTAASVAGGSNGGTSGGGISVLNQSGLTPVGTLAITGTARQKQAVAAFVDKLGAMRGLTTPYLASVSTDASGVLTFTVDVVVTTDALGGRFAATTSGGK
jgi:Tfp pilus assembly protein PilN